MCLPGTIELTIHVVLKGGAYLWLDDHAKAAEMAPGSLALVPGGPDHHLANSPRTACIPHERFLEQQAREDHSGHPDASVFMCGAYRFRGDVGQGLLRSLPSILVLRPTADDSLHQIIALISQELTEPAPGQQTALDRLLDLLVVFAMRAAFQQGPSSPRWFQAARDARLGSALHAIHSKPEVPWTVPQLAALSGFSRPAFARNFEQALGQPPMRYLTEWRMTLARDYLRMDELSITEIAQRVGYGSPNAFAATFQRHHGRPPGRWRDGQRESHTSPSDDRSITGAATRSPSRVSA
jgi:AraC-like DNA-binding protein